MHKHIILFFSVSLIFTACNNNKPPAGIIAEPQMIKLLTDIHLVDGELYNVSQQNDSLYKYGTNKYAAVFKRYRTNDAAFTKSLKYYTTQPEKIQDMYNKIDGIIKHKIDSLNKAGTKKSKNAVSKK